jgi:hypothetical protein
VGKTALAHRAAVCKKRNWTRGPQPVTTLTVLLILLPGLLAGGCLTLATPRAGQAVRPLVGQILGNRRSWYLLGSPWRQLG